MASKDAAHLVNLTTGNVLATEGIMNPQIRFGEDLMSRVSYVTMHPQDAAIERMRIDAENLKPRFSVIGSELWSDDPGLAEAAGGKS